LSGKIDLWSNETGSFGDLSAGDTLGEEALVNDKTDSRTKRLENAVAIEESFLLEIRRDKWNFMKDLLFKL